MTSPRPNSLVLYKNRPAKLLQSGDKLEIKLEDGRHLKVRPKDVALLHPGPMDNLSELKPQFGEVETAWELLAGSTTSLPELADLIFEAYTPATAWATWELVLDGLYFSGEPDAITAVSAEQVAQTKVERAAKIAREQAWSEFIDRARQGQVKPDDQIYLRDVETLAYGRVDRSRVLNALDMSETPETAHAWLLKTGVWDETTNPYPSRLGLLSNSSSAELTALPPEERLDLTHLPAFAIDDEGSQDPDDALSLEGSRLWVHIADVAALVTPDSPADLEARARGANLYLPERTVTMLPSQATRLLALGLSEISPALSMGLDLNDQGEVTNLEIRPSWVKVQRLSYEEVEAHLDQTPFKQLYQVAQTIQARRRANGEISIDLPEVKIRVIDGEVVIKPLPSLRSRDLVREAMLAAGEAVARFAARQGIPFPFTTQDAPEPNDFPDTIAGHFARRLTLRRSQLTSMPGPHAGLGLEIYAKATSPLRRYSDLVVHQQLRAYLQGTRLLDTQQILERVGAAEAVEGDVRRAERLSRQHWTLVYLMRRPDWHGQGVVLEKRGPRSLILIPELDLETQLHLREDLPPDSTVALKLNRVNLAELDAHFRIATE
ncbi:MAG: RNB domain-containing ribonuclease [Anaerolineae bacterium]|nr:RNB domain-containing ribonuclease [Anaerolineae bacterium]MCB0222440.1 RNB domain-containing ribonuclease [Anaerolineae bacterium]